MEKAITHFNIRVYGLIINSDNQLLVTDEYCAGMFMTKFPGGGLEFGEGLTEALKREFLEECSEEIDVTGHFYTTDFFQVSAFNTAAQLISVYYTAKFSGAPQLMFATYAREGLEMVDDSQVFRWISLDTLSEDDLTWPVDKFVVSRLLGGRR